MIKNTSQGRSLRNVRGRGYILRLRGNLILLLVAMIWGMAFSAQRAGMEYIGPFAFNGIRLALGCVSLLPLLYYFHRKNRGAAEKAPQGSAWRAGLATGSIMFIDLSFQQVGLVYTTAGKAAFITCLYIILVPIGGVFLKHRIAGSTWVGAALSIVGLYFLCVKEGFAIEYGDLIILGSAVFGAAHILAIGHYARNVDSLQLAFCQFFVCSVASLAVAAAIESVALAQVADAAVPILYGGFMSVGIAYTLQIVGQKYADPSHAVIIMSLESVFGALAGYFFLGELLGIGQLAGCALMLAGVLISQLGSLTAIRAKLKGTQPLAGE